MEFITVYTEQVVYYRMTEENFVTALHLDLCSACKRRFNERTGMPFNFLDYPTDVVLLVVLCRLRYTLSLRDRSASFLQHSHRGSFRQEKLCYTIFVYLVSSSLSTPERNLS
jgi:putative transposase